MPQGSSSSNKVIFIALNTYMHVLQSTSWKCSEGHLRLSFFLMYLYTKCNSPVKNHILFRRVWSVIQLNFTNNGVHTVDVWIPNDPQSVYEPRPSLTEVSNTVLPTCSDAIKIHNKTIFDFYKGLLQIDVNLNPPTLRTMPTTMWSTPAACWMWNSYITRCKFDHRSHK